MSTASKFRLFAVYSAMLAGAVLLYFAIRWYGETLAAPPPTAAETAAKAATAGHVHPLLHVLIALAAVIVCGKLLGRLLSYVGQPPVIGEVAAGILLGPSLLGHDLSALILPPSVAPYLQVIAQLGVILYMFLVGLELNAGLLREKVRSTIAISSAGIAAPFLCGAAIALYLYPRFSSSDVTFTSFSLFLGVSLSVTAFPVLARILTDMGMSKTTLGVMALASSATGDVLAWCLLALVVGVAQGRPEQAALTVGLSVGYILIMFFMVRPLLAGWLEKRADLPVSVGLFAAAIVGVLLSALATEAIGIHAIFGAFLAGAVIPHDSQLARHLTNKLSDITTVLLLPAFFAFTGMRTQIGLVSGLEAWLVCGLIILVATLGKFGGTFAAARLTGHSWKESSALGVLMNTRGLMELIVLTIGLDLGVISPTLFAMLVLMALATTMATTPVLHLLRLSASTRECRSVSPAQHTHA